MVGWTRKLGLATALAVLGVGAAGVAPAGAIAPPAPLGCATAVQSFANGGLTPIPDAIDDPGPDDLDTPGVLTANLAVAGVVGPVLDIDVTTVIGHTFNSDLVVTLTSPAGTVVTLTSNNGAGHDNVFAGTFWDDSADDTVVDHAYTNGLLASPLNPEEPLAAFNGEDPNGVWVLTINDTENLDTGNLGAWGISITSLTGPAFPATTQNINATPVAIPTGPGTVQQTVSLGALPYLYDIEVLTDITHTFNADLDITLTSPAGTEITLTTDNGAGHDNVFNSQIWDDDADSGSPIPYTGNPQIVTDHIYANNVPAGQLTPEEPLGALIGEDPNGTWTLTVTDDLAGDGGTLNAFGVRVTGLTCVPAPPPPPIPPPLPGPPVPPAPPAPTGNDVDVIAGADRVGTAIKVSQASFADGAADAVVLARRDDFPDALAGTPLAAAVGGPMLLTSPSTLESDVADEIERVLGGAGDVYVLGGTGALSATVASQLASAGHTVQRIFGENRYETAVEIAEELGSPETVLEASGLNFPDAVSAGAAAIEAGAAVLLTNGASQSAATAAYLAANPGTTRFAVGGPAASADPSAIGLVGFNRFETSALVATRFFPTPTVAGVASGRAFPDALTGGVHIGVLGGPMLLTEPDDLPAPITDFLDANFEAISQVFVYGGSAAIGQAVIDEIVEAIT